MISNIHIALTPHIDDETRRQIFSRLNVDQLEELVRQDFLDFIDLVLVNPNCDSDLLERILDFHAVCEDVAKKISSHSCCNFEVLMALVDCRSLGEDFYIDNVLNHPKINCDVLDRFMENGQFSNDFTKKYIITHKLADDYIKGNIDFNGEL